MKRTRFHLGGRKLIASLMALSATLFGLVALAPSASAAPYPYCGSSKYVEKIEVAKWSDNQFQIVLTPTGEARADAAFSPNPRNGRGRAVARYPGLRTRPVREPGGHHLGPA